MVGVNWQPPSSDEPREELDRLFAVERARKAQGRADLAASLGETPPMAYEEPEPERRQSARRTPAEPILSDALPFGIELPKRTTHGGPFGPKVRRKLIAEAMRYRW